MLWLISPPLKRLTPAFSPRLLKLVATVLNWLVDVAGLWLTLRLVGVSTNPTSVVVAFALANLAAIVPLTPGGIGVVELSLAATLVGLGAPAAPTAVGIAAYRVFNFWLPIPGSALAYLAAKLHEFRREHRLSVGADAEAWCQRPQLEVLRLELLQLETAS